MEKVIPDHAKKSVSDFVIDRLNAWRVERVFGYPGDGINGLLASFDRATRAPDFVLLPHEEHASFAACAHAKFTGQVGVCLSTSGPGALHLLTGLFDAKCDHQPVLALIGQQATFSLGASYQQEIDLISLLRPACAYVAEIAHPSQIVHAFDRAMRVAVAERAAVALVLPRDVQTKALEFPPHEHGVSYSSLAPVLAPSSLLPPAELLEEAAQLLNAAIRPAILVGAGALGAGPQVREVAERLGAGLCKALLGKTVVSDLEPYVTGSIGLLGTPGSQQLMDECDALLLVGTSFPYCENLPAPGQAKAVHIDSSASRVGLRYSSSVNLVGGARETLQALLPLLRGNASAAKWRARVEEMARKSWDQIRERALQTATPLNPQRVMYELSPLLPHDAIVCCDSGTTTVWAGRILRMTAEMKFSVSGSLASMGCALPYAVGAKLAYPDRPVIAVLGDGCAMQMSGMGLLIAIGELSRQWQDKRFVVLVLRNRELSQVTWEQRVSTQMRKFAASQNIPDVSIVPFARQLGFTAHVVEKADDVQPLWQSALSSTTTPVLIEAITDAQVPILPPQVTDEQVHSLAKAVKEGDENSDRFLAQIAKENPRVCDAIKAKTSEMA